MKRFSLMALAALLVICGPARAQPDPIVTAAEGYKLRLMGAGLASGRIGLHSYPVFTFGISRAEALQRVAALRGPASATGVGRNCGRRPLAFSRFDRLTLWFRGARWVGWSLTGPRGRRPIDTEYDLGIGTERRHIDSTDGPEPIVRRTARGFEFEAEDMKGLLSGSGPRARIVAIWSGDTCPGR